MMLLEFTFWFLFLSIVYCYFGYPVLLQSISKLRKREVKKGKYEPKVSILISVWNEEDVIADKIDNLININYPKENIEILIGSDGSDDKTNAIIKKIKDPRVQLFVNEDRLGKMKVLNDLIEKAQGEVVVFTDARQMFDKNAVKHLVNNFADENVGCVSGELIFKSNKKMGTTAKGISKYWNYEKDLRKSESTIHSMIGATGAIYAIRKNLFTKIPENVVLDDVYVPLKIVQYGFRAIFESQAKAYDQVADNPQEEYSRKVRTLYGNFQIFKLFQDLFNPFVSPISIQFFSHKLLRTLVPFIMIALFAINGLLTTETFFKFTFIVQLLFYSMAAIGLKVRNEKKGILSKLSRVCYVPYIFCLLNVSALAGFIRFIRDSQDVTWQKARRA